MSNEHGGPAPVPDPYAAPEPASTPPGPQPAAAAPAPPYGSPQHGAPQYAAPQYGAPQYAAPQYGAPQYAAPEYGAPPYGAPQYGAPPAGAPQYGAPYGGQPYGYPQAYAAPPTEGMAIASFVTSTAGLLFFGGLPGPVGLGLGIAALRRIKVSGKSGRGWAIAGIAIGAVGILSLLAIIAYVVAIVVFLGTASTAPGFWDDVEQGFEEGFEEGSGGSFDESTALPDYTLRTDLTAGTCLSELSYEYDMADTGPVDCAVPHDAEVIALVELTGPVSTDPTDESDPAFDQAWTACDELTTAVLPTYFADGNIELYYPHPDDFATGGTSAYCVYYGDASGMTGSATTGTLHLADPESLT